MVEIQSEPLHPDPINSVLLLFGIIASYLMVFIVMMLVIRMMVNCVFNHLLRRPHNILVIVE